MRRSAGSLIVLAVALVLWATPALAHFGMEPEALLLDEPTSGLDPETRDRLIAILVKLAKPVIIISHDWDFLARVTDTYYSIEHGRLASSPGIVLHRHVHGHPLGNLEHQHLGLVDGAPAGKCGVGNG